MNDTSKNEANTEDGPIVFEKREHVAVIRLNRPDYRNAQNAKMTFALDEAFQKAMQDDQIKVVVLCGAGKHFSAGHDIGTPERDIHRSFPRVATSWWDHENREGAEAMYVREQELYLEMCRRWRELPKPTIAMVHGACVAGALMLAWVCDLIIASEDAFFSDPVVRMGIPGVEYFAHPFVMNPRQAKEFLFLGEKWSAKQAHEMGMINRVVEKNKLEETTMDIANRIAQMPSFGLALTKKAINQAEDRMGLRDTMETSFALHHLAHAHNGLTSEDHLAGQDAKSMAATLKKSSVK
jgi:enoyl-CoA hydratase